MDKSYLMKESKRGQKMNKSYLMKEGKRDRKMDKSYLMKEGKRGRVRVSRVVMWHSTRFPIDMLIHLGK